MNLGRRSAFFGGLAIVCLLLWEPTPPEYRWVNLFAAALALVWAGAAALEDRSLGRWRPSRRRSTSAGGPSGPVKRA
ncbi:MAG: hypothetical protein OEV60_09445 [Actinomycetota bacterium]|nr:hypothetical protein [Actinomycetota bacterium]MDH5225310.1 hypothetical protein [Actinomycetota bacterium]MDH5313800.1 hypothetical protein [Actinomycetota bacterium]